MKYVVNLETGKEYEVVYFKHNNDQVLAEYVDGMVSTGNYEVIEKEEV